MANEIKVSKFTTTFTTQSDGYTVKLFADGVLIKETEFGNSVPIAEGQKNTLFSAENFGEYTKDFNTKYVLGAPVPPPPPLPVATPPPPPAPKPEAPVTQSPVGKYYPKSKYSKPKNAGPGKFAEKLSQKPYQGTYVKAFNKKYFAGRSPLETGIELEKISNHGDRDAMLLALGIGLLGTAIAGFFKKKPSKSERENGVTKRYYVQDMNNNKIAETDKVTYTQTKLTTPNRIFAEVDWIIKGPAEDKMFGNYPFEGAESKNRKTIQALESQMKGISTFVTDYKYLVEEPVVVLPQAFTTETFIELDPDIQLENDRKANFDTKK